MFDLELEKVITQVKEREAKQVVIQLPDGLKTKARDIVDAIEKETSATVLIWLSSCFGACDIPLGLEKMNVDFFIQWGHNRFHKEDW